MWILLTVPLMVLACAIAILPVLLGSVRDCRSQQAARASAELALQAALTEAFSPPPSFQVTCPPCGALLEGASALELLQTVNSHAWLAHGVPDPEHLQLITAGAAAGR